MRRPRHPPPRERERLPVPLNPLARATPPPRARLALVVEPACAKQPGMKLGAGRDARCLWRTPRGAWDAAAGRERRYAAGGAGGVQPAPAKRVCIVIVCAAVFGADEDRGRDSTKKRGGAAAEEEHKGSAFDELKSKIGSHAEVVWYNSVVVTRQLAWQDRLNSFNLPLFLSSTSFFTNYTWAPSYTAKTVEYFRSLNPTAAPKTPRDIYMGIDVFGRGSHGGGGFGAYKVLDHITPAGLSAAFFAPGWSWESTQDAPGFTWESWFTSERSLWTGVHAGEPRIAIPATPPNCPSEPPCTHGLFAPVASFFTHAVPPDPRAVPLHTMFCPGVGRTWWVEGVRVFEHPGKESWTDVPR
ncbi:glycosyl hydrolase family 85-domain-containing protein [Mycena olivaceomarginata]|nr:glycosyl hydrolase family 85-domain-containing protein [Mycena olivaceomarginata]